MIHQRCSASARAFSCDAICTPEQDVCALVPEIKTVLEERRKRKKRGSAAELAVEWGPKQTS